MKKLLILLFSFFLLSSTSVFAEDISDFSIEGISIGDSLLDYMTEEEILEEIERTKDWYSYLNEPSKYVHIQLDGDFSTYRMLTIFISNPTRNKYITNENENETFIIKSIDGYISFEEKFDDCIVERNEVIAVLSNMFPNVNKREVARTYEPDLSGNGIEDAIVFDLKGNSTIAAICTDIDESYRLKQNWTEGLSVTITTEEINDWLSDYK